MYKIKKFEEKYNEIVNNFVASIFVEEFNFEKYRENILTYNNKNYAKSGGLMWIAVNEKDDVIGTIAIMKKSPENAELKTFYVDNNYRGNGISKKLYTTAIEYCKKIHINRVCLGTYERMETAIHFYKKRGFNEIEAERQDKDEDAKFFEMYI